VYFAERTSDSVSVPAKVHSATFLALGRHRGPRILITPSAIVISAIVREKRRADGDLTAWRSTDSGQSGSTGIRVNDVPASAPEGADM